VGHDNITCKMQRVLAPFCWRPRALASRAAARRMEMISCAWPFQSEPAPPHGPAWSQTRQAELPVMMRAKVDARSLSPAMRGAALDLLAAHCFTRIARCQ
jgi:hypothetical protein